MMMRGVLSQNIAQLAEPRSSRCNTHVLVTTMYTSVWPAQQTQEQDEKPLAIHVKQACVTLHTQLQALKDRLCHLGE
jgi:hypothetical protein